MPQLGMIAQARQQIEAQRASRTGLSAANSRPMEISKPAGEKLNTDVDQTPLPPTVTDKASYDAYMAERMDAVYKQSYPSANQFAVQYDRHWKPATTQYNCNFVSSIDPSRQNIRQQTLQRVEQPDQAPHKLECLRQARRLAVDRARILEPAPTEPAFAGGWQDGLLAKMTSTHAGLDREQSTAREVCLQRTERERTLSFEEKRAALQSEQELVRPHLRPAVALRDIGEYQRSGMLADNPHMHRADATIAWKQEVASRGADLRAASNFHGELQNRQMYLDAGMYHMTNQLQ